MQEYRPIQILLVEDNLDDVTILRRALDRAQVPSELHLVRDGEEAVNLLFTGHDAEGRAAPRPDLVLLDINTPRLSGLEVLQRIKEDDELCTLPVVMLTVSARNEDVTRAYRLGANTYVQKPVEFKQFVRVLEVLGEYWFEVAKLPPKAG
ncbi:MAG: response regulator [Dehalococcoidia bacterium]